MTNFSIHTKDTAPENSIHLLKNSEKSFGMIPNLHGVMAESAPVLEAYQQLHKLFQETSFNAEELTVIWQTINVEHNCSYCIPAHSAIAASMKVDMKIVKSIINKKNLDNKKLQVLHDTVLELVKERGILSEYQANKFYEVGYGNKQLLELVLGIAQKVMSNYINHLARTPTDNIFKKFDNNY